MAATRQVGVISCLQDRSPDFLTCSSAGDRHDGAALAPNRRLPQRKLFHLGYALDIFILSLTFGAHLRRAPFTPQPSS
jgi:hypothetical protein